MALMTRLVSCCDTEEDMNVVREQMREEVQWLKQATAVTEEADQVRREGSGRFWKLLEAGLGLWLWSGGGVSTAPAIYKPQKNDPNFMLISRYQ